LPSLEVAFFSDAMPRHWQYLAEKKPEVQKILDYDRAKGDLERTQLVVIASLVSLRESLLLLASQADLGYGDETKRGWPELAPFDCYACHHDLKADGWRPKRGYPGVPARPQMRRWPTPRVALGV